MPIKETVNLKYEKIEHPDKTIEQIKEMVKQMNEQVKNAHIEVPVEE